MSAKGALFPSRRRVGNGSAITRPSVALRDGDLGYGVKSQADLVIRVPMGGGTHVASCRYALTSEVARTTRREAGRWGGGNADHQIRTLPMEGEAKLKSGSSDVG